MAKGLVAVLWVLACAHGTANACAATAADALFAHGFELCGPRTTSTFLELGADLDVAGPDHAPVLAHTVALAQPAQLVIVADGRLFPRAKVAAELLIAVNGDADHSSRSVIDWTDSLFPVQHSFRVLAAAQLQAGEHRIELLARVLPGEQPGGVAIGAGSGLATLVDPNGTVTVRALNRPSPAINVQTYSPASGIDTLEGGADRPWVTLLSQTLTNETAAPTQAISLVAGRVAHACRTPFNSGRGDALWGLVADGICPRTDQAAWGVQDVDEGAELVAPLSAQSAHPMLPGEDLRVDWVASELAFGSDQADAPAGAHENGVCYTAGSTRMISVVGSAVAGRATQPEPAFCSTYTFECIASTDDLEGCPPVGTEVVLGRAIIDVPEGHDGRVMFSAQTRVQGTNDNGFATASLFLRVDGERLGTIGVQQLDPDAGQASRTLTAAYLSAYPSGRPLAPGQHTIEVIARGDGEDLRFLTVPRDLPLVWFD